TSTPPSSAQPRRPSPVRRASRAFSNPVSETGVKRWWDTSSTGHPDRWRASDVFTPVSETAGVRSAPRSVHSVWIGSPPEPSPIGRCRGGMKRSLVVAAALALAAVLAGAASAKGPAAVTITGPGLDDPIVLRGNAEGGATSRIGRIVQFGGWFPQAFGQVPDSTTKQAPTKRLGPRYVALWVVPVGAGRSV